MLTKGVDPQTLERDGSANPNDEVPGIDLPGGMEALHSLANVPKSWPLAIFFFALCCLGKIPGGAPFSQLHKSGNGSRVDRP